MIFSECKRHNTVSKQKLPGGVLKVTRCSFKRQDCKCVKSCKTVFLRYKCKKPVQRVLCKCSRGRCRKERYITVWRLSNVVVAVCGTLSVNHRRFDATQLGGCHTVQQENQNTIRRVNCTRRVLRAIQGRCKGGKQRYIVHYWVKIGCRCVRRVRSEFRKCACAHKAVDLFLVVDLYGKDRRGYKKRIVSFLKTVSTYFLHTSASVHITMVSYNWNVHVHKLKHLKNLPIKAFTNTRTDLCGALKEVNRRLHAKSRPGVEKIVVIITCGKHSKQHKTVALADKIKRKASVFVVGFRPIPKSGLYVKWLASKPIKMHYMELGIRRKYHFSATRLFERICKKACAKPVVKHSACHKHNCRRVYTRTTFYLDRRRKKCVRRSKSWWKLCCCIHRDSVEKKCYKNRLYRVVTSYRFKKHACHRSVRRYDISAQVHAACRPRSKLHRGPCRKDGWRKDTIVTRHVAQCRCKVGRRHQLIRCRCPKQHVVNTCVRGNHQQRCHYTYTLKPTGCTKNRRCRTSRVTCKTRKIVRGKCNRSSCKRSMGSIWYTVRNCKCKRHYKVASGNFRNTATATNVRSSMLKSILGLNSTNAVVAACLAKFTDQSAVLHLERKKSKCAARQNGFYRKWVECYWKKRNCVCIKYTKSRYELCRCRRGYATKKCRSGSLPQNAAHLCQKFCLSKQRHFRRSFILAQRTSFDVCMSSCQKNSKCRAFDYDHSTRKCLLLRINRRGLLLRFPSLKLRKTRDCILFERICPTKCPFRRILKQYKCSCIKLGKQRVCYRTAAVATWKRNRSGSCQRRVHKLRVPCRKCEDRREFCKKSKCSRHLVRHLCNYLRIKNLRCVRCQVGSYQLIGPCKNGQRKITKIVARFVNGRCRISSHAKTYSCKNCGLVTRKLISKCYRHGKKWIRQGHCIVRRSLAVFSCSPKCPRDRSTVSQCKCGKRIRCFIYYVTYPGSNVCVPKRYTSSEKCASTQ
uniref:Apple domain-containing protein n=1 Tax=Macrostomum lignano TaxID=282301 RepID=A0A1I8FT25_9PLAT